MTKTSTKPGKPTSDAGGQAGGAAPITDLVVALDSSGEASLLPLLNAGWRERARTWIGLALVGGAWGGLGIELARGGGAWLLVSFAALWPALVIRELITEITGPGGLEDRWLPAPGGAYLGRASVAAAAALAGLFTVGTLARFLVHVADTTGDHRVAIVAMMLAVIGGLGGLIRVVKVWFRALVALALDPTDLASAARRALAVGAATPEFRARNLKDKGAEWVAAGSFVVGVPLAFVLAGAASFVVGRLAAGLPPATWVRLVDLSHGLTLATVACASLQVLVHVLTATELISLVRSDQAAQAALPEEP